MQQARAESLLKLFQGLADRGRRDPDDLVRSGKVRYVGFSNWSAWQAAKAVGIQEKNGYTRFAGAQLYYSLLGRDAEHELDKEHGFELVERMRALASDHGASVSRVALAWLLAKRGVSSVLVRVSKENQLEDNLGAVTLRLTHDELTLLDEASPHTTYYPNWFNARLRDTAVDGALSA